MPDPRQKLYNAISKDFDLGTFEQFNTKMNDANSRQKLYNAVSDKFDLGSFDEFNSKIGSVKKKDLASASTDGSSGSPKNKSAITNVSSTLNTGFEQQSKKPKVTKQTAPKNIPTSSNKTWGKNLVDTLENAPTLFQEYQQAKSLSSDEVSSVKQDLDDEINNEGFLNNVINLAKDVWNTNQLVFSLDLQMDKNPLAKNLQQVREQHGNNISPEKATKMAYDMELEKRSASLSESKERAYLTQAQKQGKIEPLKKEQLKVYDERSKEYSSLYLKDGALKNGLEEQGKLLANLKTEIEKSDPKAEGYNDKLKQFQTLQQNYTRTFNEYEANSNNLQKLGSEVSGFEHNLDMLKRDYGYWSNFSHRIGNALGDTGKGLVSLAVEAPIDYAIGTIEMHGKEAPGFLKGAKETLQQGRSNYDVSKEQRQSQHAKDIQVDDIHSLGDFGRYALDLTASQSFNLVSAGSGLGGLAIIGTSSAGQKRAEMSTEMEEGKDYNLAQQIGVPLLVGASEMAGAYVDRLMLNRVASTIKAVSSNERKLIAEGMATQFTKNYLTSTGQEVAEETSVQLFQNVLDKYALGKKDVNVLDGVKDAGVGALVLTSTISAGGGLASVGIEALKPFSYDKSITKLSEQITKFETQLSNPNLDEGTRNILTEQIKKLNTKAETVLKKRIENIESLSNEQFQEILSLEKQQSELRNKANEVKKSNLDADSKQEVLKGLEEDFRTNDERRLALLQRGSEIQLERLPIEDQKRLKEQAESELKTTSTTEEISPNDIAKRALKIYADESKQNSTEETTTKQEEEITTENAETTTEPEYNAQDDLNFIESLVTENSNQESLITENDEKVESKSNKVVDETAQEGDITPNADIRSDVNEVGNSDISREQQDQDRKTEEILSTNDSRTVSDKAEYQPRELKVSEKGETYTTSQENGMIVFKDSNGKEPSAPTKRKLQKEYVKNEDFSQGKLAEESDMVNEKNMNQVIAKHSENPTQIAEAIMHIGNTDYESDLEYKYVGIADYIGKVERSSFLRFGDKNFINQSIAKQYIAKKGKGQQIDTLAQEVSEVLGVEVTPEDIIDFIVENPNGVQSFRNQQKSQDLYELKLKFEQVTGLPATETVLNAILDKQINTLKDKDALSSLDFLTLDELNFIDNERQEWENSNDRIVQEVTETSNSEKDGRRSEISQESDGLYRGEEGKSEPTGVDVATDEELETLFKERITYEKTLDFFDNLIKEIDDFGKNHLSMGIPLVVAKEVIKAMRLAVVGSKKASDIVKAGYDYLINTEWYKGLSKRQQSKITFTNFKNLIAESVRQVTKAEKEIKNLEQELGYLRQSLVDNKTEALEISKMIKAFLKSNKITGKVTPTEINRLVTYANRISVAKDKVRAFDDFVNTFNKIHTKAQQRTIKLSDRVRVENKVKKLLKQGKSEQEIIESFKENSSDSKIAEDYFERTKVRTDDEIRTKLNGLELDYYANRYKKTSLSAKANKIYEKTVQAFFDRAFTFKKALNKAGMQFATSLYIATKGAPGYANYLYEKAHKDIFAGLTTEQIKNLNTIIRLRRIIAIENDGYKNQKDPMVHTKKLNKQQAEQGLKVREQDLGATEFALLKERADKFFNQQRELLKQLYDNGIVSEEFYNDMKDVEYIKTRYLDFLKDTENNAFNVSKGASTDSGIEKLSNGWDGTVELNANELLAQSINTTAKAIASNRLNRNLVEEYNSNKAKVEALLQKTNLTKEEQELVNGFKDLEKKIIPASTFSAKPPHGYTKVIYFENGDKKAFFMEDGLYKVYSDNVGTIWSNSKVKDVVQTAMGVNLVKTIATGQNPTFFITNTPRDFFWIINTSTEYSNFIPKAGYQLTKDFVKGSLDVKRDSVSYQKAVEYGLLMDFLHLQGKLSFDVNPTTRFGKTLKFLGDNKGVNALKYLWEQGMILGKYSEIGFRMAVFNRASQNLLAKFNEKNATNYKSVEAIDESLYPNSKERIYTEAVAEARESTVDFNQGGHLSKDLESFIPYFNAATQGTRMLIEKVAENPRQTILRFTQTAGIVTGMGVGLSMILLKSLQDDDDNRDAVDLYNEFYSGVSKFDRANYIVIPTGKSDDREYEYTRIALPQALTPFFTLSRGFTHDFLNKINGKEKANSFTFEDTQFALQKNLLPIELGITDNIAKVPIFKSAFSYTTGYDFFREQDISIKRGKVDPIAEGYESKSVEGFYKELGSKFEFSPARAKTATEALVTTPSTNIAVGMAYGTMNVLFSKEQNDKNFGELALKSFGGRVVKTTSDFNRKVSNTDAFKEKNASRDVYNARLEYQAKIEVDRYYEGELKKSEAISSIKDIFGKDQRRIKNYIGRLDKNYSKFSSDAQEIKFASADKKASLLVAHFGSDLYKQDKLNDKQKELRKELVKMKVLTESTRNSYKLEASK